MICSGDQGQDCLDYVTGLGKQNHATPNLQVENPGRASLLGQKGVPQARQTVRMDAAPLCTPVTEGQCHQTSLCRSPVTKKLGRKLFPDTSPTDDHAQENNTVSNPVCTGDVRDISDDASELRRSQPVTPSEPSRGRGRASGPSRRKHARVPQEPEAVSSEKKSSAKRRRLYSQPLGVIEPDAASGSQKSDEPSTAVAQQPQPADAASRANESVYDMLLEHSARKSGRGGRGRRAPGKAVGGRRSAATRGRRSAVPPPTTAAGRSSPRVPRRRAAAAAAGHLRDCSSQTSDSEARVSDKPPTDTSEAAAEARPQDAEVREILDRGNTEFFYLPTVVPPDDDSSDDDVFEPSGEPPAEPEHNGRAAERSGVSGATYCSSNGATPEHGRTTDDSKTAADAPSEEQCQAASADPRDPSSESGSSQSPPKSSPEGCQSVPRPGQLSSGSFREVNGGPSWLGSGRRASKTHSRMQGATCYVHAGTAALSPHNTKTNVRGLRRYSYLSQTPVDKGKRAVGRRAGGGTDGRRGAGQISPPSTPRGQRPFFGIDPESDNGSACGGPGSVSDESLVVERDPLAYRLRSCELGPNLSQWAAEPAGGPHESGTNLSQRTARPRESRPNLSQRTGGPRESGPNLSQRTARPRESGPSMSQRTARPRESEPNLSQRAADPTGGLSRPEWDGRGGSSVPARVSVTPVRHPGGAGAPRSDPVPTPSSPPSTPRGRLGRRPTREARLADGWADQAAPGASAGDQMGALLECSRSADVGTSPLLHQPETVDPASAQPETDWDEPLGTPLPLDDDVSAGVRAVDGLASQPPLGKEREASPARPDGRKSRAQKYRVQEESERPPSISSVAEPHLGMQSRGDPDVYSKQNEWAKPRKDRPLQAAYPCTDITEREFGPSRQEMPETERGRPAAAGRPASFGPATPGPHPAPGAAIGSELARLVVRWRQLARLEQRALTALRAAQHRQRALVDVQRRVWDARLKEGQQARTGILAACDMLERLVTVTSGGSGWP